MGRPPGFPFPPWILILDLFGVLLVLGGAMGLFADMGDLLGPLGQEPLPAILFGFGLLLVTASLLLIVFHLRQRQGR